jgi:hypothetical protein
MRLLLIAVALSLGAGATFAQIPTQSHPIVPALRPHLSGIVGCVQMWDSGTHMTKQEWLRACRRVQTRLDRLDAQAVMRKTKTER